MLIITTITDLRTWIANHNPGGVQTAPDMSNELTEALRNEPGRPAWGEDWAEWLDANAEPILRRLCEAA